MTQDQRESTNPASSGQRPPGHGNGHGHRHGHRPRHNVSRHNHNALDIQPPGQVQYDFPDSFLNLDNVDDRRHGDEEREGERRGEGGEGGDASTATWTESSTTWARQRSISQVSVSDRQSRMLQRHPSSRIEYDVPDSFVNVAETLPSPVANPAGAAIYRHSSLEQSRSRDQEYLRRQESRRRSQVAGGEAIAEEHGDGVGVREIQVSRFATEFYTVSYLILFSILGTLARLGLQSLTSYPGTPISFSSIWPNFAGSVMMGFLSEDRMLFRNEWGTPTYEQHIKKTKQRITTDEENGESSGDGGQGGQVIDLAAARKAYMATKKTIPLYIGLATGFCGSFTSFSSFIRDMFLALSNDLQGTNETRNGGYSVMAVLAVLITTVSLSLGGLFVGAHLAIALEPIMPSFPFVFTRNVVDRVGVFVAWFSWVGAILLTVWPSDRFNSPGASETWRGRVTFSLIFSPLGCLARFYTSLHLNGRMASFPLGTFAVNVFGTAVLGMAWDLAHVPIGGLLACQALQGIEDGFCACLTTVSTWVAELAALRRGNAYIYGGASVSVALAIMVAIMGGLRWSEGFAPLLCIH